MNKSHFVRLLLLVTAGVFLSFPAAFGDDGHVATLGDIHKVLLEAAGYHSDAPPTIAEQTDLLNKALKMMEELPHVYHGHLAAAKRSIDAALNELEGGDGANKAKGDIYDADDQIKSIM